MKNLKLLFLIIFLGSLFFPLIGLALSSYQGYGTTIYYEGLVPCGKSEPLAEGESEEVKLPCQFCHFFVMFKSILDFVLKLVIIIAVLMLTVGGFMFFFAGGNPAALDRAKGILTSTAIGLVIIFAAWLIVNSILTFPGFINPQLSWDPTKWFQVECPIEKIITKEREKKEDYQKKIERILIKNVDAITDEEWDFIRRNPEMAGEALDEAVEGGQITNEQAEAFKNTTKDKGITITPTPTVTTKPTTVTVIKINSASGKSCYKVCKEQGEGFLCESVGLNKAVNDGQMWDIEKKWWGGYDCVKKKVESKGSIGCLTRILKHWGIKVYCPKEGKEKHPPQWTQCKCVKTE